MANGMLTIGKMSQGQESYYSELAREDYYHSKEGGEPPGHWYGEGARALDLTGQVEKEVLSEVFQGRIRGESMVQKGAMPRCPGWDLTFSAPKSVSTLWSQADSETARGIQECQQRAVEKALDYLQSECGYTRRGKGGVHVEPADLVFATFEHGTSRAQQPQLHTHALLLNLCIREDGTTGALKTEPLFRHKMAAGALYRAELSAQLEKHLGLESMADKHAFKLIGVPDDLCAHFSDRRKEILEALKLLDSQNAKTAAKVAYTTRKHKEHQPRGDLFAGWQEIGKQFGWTPDRIGYLLGKAPDRTPSELEARTRLAVVQGVESIMDSHASFTERQVIRFAAQAAQGQGIGADQVIAEVRQHLKESPEIVALGVVGEDPCFTTREHYEIEKRMMATIGEMRQASGLVVSEKHIARALEQAEEKGKPLTAEQTRAVRHIVEGEGAIATVTGDAGTGKTTVLKPLREVLEKSGYEVRGAALAGKAAQGMQDGAGIQSQTLASLLWGLDKIEAGWSEKQARQDFNDWVKEEKQKRITKDLFFNPKFTAQVAEAAKKRFQEFAKGNALTEKTVLVVDEAAMVDTRTLARLVEHVRKAGCKLVLVGDHKQLQAIETGGAFKAIADEQVRFDGGARLTEIFRQKGDAKKAVEAMAQGRVEHSLRHYAESGDLHILDERTSAKEALIDEWAKRGLSQAARHRIRRRRCNPGVPCVLKKSAQVTREIARCLVARFLPLGEAFQTNPVHLSGDTFVKATSRSRLVAEHALQALFMTHSLERTRSRKHLIKHSAEAEHVRTSIG